MRYLSEPFRKEFLMDLDEQAGFGHKTQPKAVPGSE
jgi:hypothetical protein